MRKTIERTVCAALALILALAAPCALADGGWDCPVCGQTGNVGNFCPSCGSPAPEEGWTCEVCGQPGNTGKFCVFCGSPAPEEGWTCYNCGQTGNKGNFCSNCAAPKPGSVTPAPQTPVNEHLEQIPGEAELVKVCLDRVQASSYIVNQQNPIKWVPENAVDNNETTCWQFSARRGLNGQSWLVLYLTAPEAVDMIWFKNGFWGYTEKGDDQYVINARPKMVRVEFLYAGESAFRDSEQVALRDESRNGWQRASLRHRENVTAVRLVFTSIYKGSHFANDVCLSEVMMVQKAPASIAKAPQAEGAPVIYESRPEVSGCSLLMRLATRSGPGTEYDEPGIFFNNNWQQQKVRVLGKSYDGSIWWVLVDFSNGSKGDYRIWTGLKRVDVDLNKLKEIKPIGDGYVSPTGETYRGPGGKYAKAKVTISGWQPVKAYDREKGYVEIEFKQGSKVYRLWVPEAYTFITWK
ncbi:MAG: hypothetical protein IKH38_01340 [Clostridia bacterium]|nr:hypothetical protein [Clostridia bacterium]